LSVADSRLVVNTILFFLFAAAVGLYTVNMDEKLPKCREVKYHYSGKIWKADCGLVHLEEGMAVLKYYFRSKWHLEELHLGPPMYTYAFYWEDRPYNLYLWYRADGSLDAAYFNVVDSVRLGREQVEYRDLIVDVLLYPEGTWTVLDRHELTDDMPEDLLDYIEAAQAEVEAGAAEIVARARTFLALRGLDNQYQRGLSSSRLRLEPSRPEQADEVSEYYRRNRDFLSPWEPEREEQFYTAAVQQELLQQQVKSSDILVFWVRLNSGDDAGRLIGFVKFSNIIRGPFQSCYLSYALDGEQTRRGYMSEALEAAIGYLFEFERMHRIEANIVPENEASLRTVAGLGFEDEGISRSYLRINGCWRDHVHMVRLNEK